MNAESDRLAKIAEILNWTNPGLADSTMTLAIPPAAAPCERRRF